MKQKAKKLAAFLSAAAIAMTAAVTPETGSILGALAIRSFAAEPVTYLNRVWNESEKKIIGTNETLSEYLLLKDVALDDNGDLRIGNGNVNSPVWYVVNSDYTIDNKIFISGAVNLLICNGATLTVKKGIVVNTGNTLSIYGQQGDSGKIIATGEKYCAGIGGEDDRESGIINIYGGTIEATGGEEGAGVGGGNECSNGTINIYGSRLIATGGRLAAGIGGGDDGTGGTINIYDADITAKGGYYGAGVGGGEDKSGGNITIYNVFNLNATGGEEGAGIGGGDEADAGTIKIYNGRIEAHGGRLAAGIGGGDDGTGGTIDIYSGNITTNGGYHGAGIGGGEGGDGGNIHIYSLSGDINGGYRGAGIGGGKSGDSGTIIIDNGKFNVCASSWVSFNEMWEDGGAGIGGGYNGDAGEITINGGTIYAKGGYFAAGIGGGKKGDLKKFVMNGGYVTAYGQNGGAGIGSGVDEDFSGTIEINGGKLTVDASEVRELDDYAVFQYLGHGAALGAGAYGNFKSSGIINFKDGGIDIDYRNETNKTRIIGSGTDNGKPMALDGKIEIGDSLMVSTGGDYAATDKRIEILTDIGYHHYYIRKCNHSHEGHDEFENQQYHRFVCGLCKGSDLRAHNQASSDWKWADDLSSASVTFYCQYCKHDYSFDSSKVTVTSEITKQPTDTSDGERTYTASVVYDGKTLTNKKTVVLEKIKWDHKNDQLAAVEGMAQNGDSEAASALIAKAKSDIAAVNYDANKTEDENNAVIDAIVAKLTADLAKQRSSDTFAAYKNEKITAVANMAHSGDCAECAELITTAQAAIGAVNYDETKTLDENIAVVDAIIEKLAADLAEQRNIDEFDKYKADQKEIADGLAKDGDTAEITALITTAKSDIDKLAYDKTKSLDENKAAIKAIITKLTSDIAAKRTSPADKPEDVFYSYKAALKAALDDIYKTYESARIREIIDAAMPGVEALTYDEDKTFEQNITVIDELITELDKALDIADFNDQFDAYRNEQKAAADALAKDSDSAEITALITTAKAAIDALNYDTAKTLDENKTAVDAIITKLTSDVDLQRNKDEFAAYKTTAKAAIDALAKDTDTPGVTQLISDAKASVNALNYDETKSLAFNKNAVDAIVSTVTAELSGQSDADRFEAYKTAQKAVADSLAIPDDCDEAKYLIAEAKAAIDALNYLESRTLDENKAAVDEIILQLQKDLETDRNRDTFDAYKNERKAAVNDISKVTDSIEVKVLISDANTAIDAVKFDEKKTLDENKAAVDLLFAKLVSDVEIQRDTDEFNTYKTEQRNAATALSKSDDNADTAQLISTAIAAIDALEFDKTMTLEANKAAVDSIVSKLASDLSAARNIDAFEKYKTEQIAIADGFAQDGDPAEKTALIAVAKADIGALKYDSTKSLDDNKAAVKAIITRLTNSLGETSGEDTFNSYKTALKNAAQEIADHPEASDAIKQIIANAMPKIEALTYDKNKTFEENIAVMEALINEINSALELQLNKEEFDAYKSVQINAARMLVRYSDGDDARKLVDDAATAISAIVYDETKTLDANKSAVDSVVEKLKNDLEKQRRSDDESSDFAKYKNTQEAAANALARDTSDTNEKALIDKAISEINALAFDKNKSLDENKAAVDAIIVKLGNDIEAYWQTVTFTIKFNSYGGSEVAPVSVKYGEKVAAPTVTKTGYELVNWTLDGVAYDFTKPVTKSFTLVAVWAPIKFTVTFYVNGEKYSEAKIEYNKLVEFPEVNVKEGFTLFGWTTDAEMKNSFTSTTPVTENLTLYAKEMPIADMLLNGEKVENLDAALTAKTGEYSIIGIYKDPAPIKKMTFAKADDTKIIVIEGNDHTLTFEGAANIKPNQMFGLSEMTLTAAKNGKAQNVTITSASDGLILDDVKISGKKAVVNAAKGDVILNDVAADCQLDVKGSAKTNAYVLGEVTATNVTGFDKLELAGKLTVTKSLTVNEIVFNEGSELYVSKDVTITVKKGISGIGKIHLCEGYKAFSLAGKAEGQIEVTAENLFREGQIIFKSALTNLNDVFDISGIVPEVTDGEYEYRIYVKSGKAAVRAFRLVLNDTAYCDWSEIVNFINKEKKPTANYTIELLSDIDLGSGFKFPGKGKYAGLTIDGNGHTLSFKGKSITLTGDLTLQDIKVRSANQPWTVKAGKYKLEKNNAELIGCTS